MNIKSNSTNIRIVLLAVFLALMTDYSGLHAQGLNTDKYTILITGDSVADCNTFYFNILIKSASGLNFRTFQGDIWISDAFLNVSPIPSGGNQFSNVIVSFVEGSSDLGVQFGAQQIATPTQGGIPSGTGGDTAVIRLNTLSTSCPGPRIKNTYMRLGQIKITRTGSGCWSDSNINKLGWYTGTNGGSKTTFTITDWADPCGRGTNLKLEVANGTYLTNLKQSKPGSR